MRCLRGAIRVPGCAGHALHLSSALRMLATSWNSNVLVSCVRAGMVAGTCVAVSFQTIWRIMAVHMVASREGRFRRRTRRRMRSSASATVRRSRKPLELRAWVRMAVKRSISAAVAGGDFSSACLNLAAALGRARVRRGRRRRLGPGSSSDARRGWGCAGASGSG